MSPLYFESPEPHSSDGQTQQWLLVRLDDPQEGEDPKKSIDFVGDGG
jgi:hypothetical protein